MEGITNASLAVDLGMEIILGTDCFDADDIWNLIHDMTDEELAQIEKETREYIYKTWPHNEVPEAWNEEFLTKEINYWIYQKTWRFK